MRPVLVLRPEPGASATAERARKLGLSALSIPLFEVEPLIWRAPDAAAFDGLLLTSANAVLHGGQALNELRGLPVYAVGDATAEAARGAGFDIAATGDSGIERLLDSVDADLQLLHLCGEDRRVAANAPQRILAVPVYRARPIDADVGSAAGAVALIHSPRAGRRFAELEPDRASIAVAAISSAAAEAVGGGWEAVGSAEAPSDDALLALAARLCNNPPPQ